MRAPLYTLFAVLALVAALSLSSLGSPSRGAFDPHAAAAPLVGAAGATAVAPSPPTGAPLDLLAPDGQLQDGRAAVDPTSPDDGAAVAELDRPDEGPAPPAPTAWAAYDPRAERNARYRAESLPRALVGLTQEDIGASLRVAYAISVETAAIFTELDERRESFYVPDDGQRHPLVTLPGHHSIACGGANYVFAEGRFPLFDELVRLEDAGHSAPELEAWRDACPVEAGLRVRCAEALQRLAAYR